MRGAGTCALQQTLSAEAASVVKHSLGLARRRGHAQVTPLHVAATLLSTRASLLRRACLKSQPHQPSHQLQCRALELCFNVALNRLPATARPFLHGQPSLSNALIAALKRAQAHQRRGCIEQQQHQQQPPLIAIQIELVQLVLSILDDPSVSRVMKEAGFSSTAVKSKLDEADSFSSVFQFYISSAGIHSTPNSPSSDQTTREAINPDSSWHSHLLSYGSGQNFVHSFPQRTLVINSLEDSLSLKEDIKMVFKALLRKNGRNVVIVDESLSKAEEIAAEVMANVERGHVPEELKSAQVIKFQFSSVALKFMKKEEVEKNITELYRKVESFADSGGTIIYIGDLQWAVDDDGGEGEERTSTGRENALYNRTDVLVSAIGKMLSWYNSTYQRVWLLATSNYTTYTQCQMKQRSLDVQWNLQAVSVPLNGLALSLNDTSGLNARVFPERTMCLNSSQQNEDVEDGSVRFPSWLKPQPTETHGKEDLLLLRTKYGIRHSSPRDSHNNLSLLGKDCFNTLSYPSRASEKNTMLESEAISFPYSSDANPITISSSLSKLERWQDFHIASCLRDGSSKFGPAERNLNSLKSIDDKEVKITLALGNSMFTDSPIGEKLEEYTGILNLLKENIPWQSETIPFLAESLMDLKGVDKDMWLLIQGDDCVGKRRLATGIAKGVFGSSDALYCMYMRENRNTPAQNCEMINWALRSNEKFVILVEDVDFADAEFIKFLSDEYENGRSRTQTRGGVSSGNAILILTTNSATSVNKPRENMDFVIQMKMVVDDSRLNSGVPATLDRKRKLQWDFPVRSKIRRNYELEEVSSGASRNGKEVIDLNITAIEDGESEEKWELSPASSDLTDEITMVAQKPLKFLAKIKKQFVFSRDSDQENQATEMFLTKFERSFHEASGSRDLSSISIDEAVLQEVLLESGSYLNTLFARWLKHVFQTSVRMVFDGNRENTNVRLCLGAKGKECSNDGFMGTCLPKGIQFSFKD